MNEIIPPSPYPELLKNPETLAKTNEIPLIAFYADIPHKHIDEVIEDIHTWYDKSKTYLIGLEYAEAREHYHFVINFTEKEYAAYVRRVLKDKYHLSGRRNKKGHTGQFGKVSKIRNIDAMCSYTLKDLHYRTNFKKHKINELIKASYPKPENDKKELMAECMQYIKTKITQIDVEHRDEPHQIAYVIMDFFKEKQMDLISTQIRKYTLRYLTYHEKIGNERLYRLLFPHGV